MDRKQIIKNKVEARNELNKHLNKIIPELIEDIKKNGVKVKTSGDTFHRELYQKDKDRLNAIIKSENKSIRVWLRVSDYSVDIKADVTAQDSEHSCCYLQEHRTVHQFNPDIQQNLDFTPFEMLTVDGVNKCLDEISRQNEIISNAQDKISAMHKKTNYLFYR